MLNSYVSDFIFKSQIGATCNNITFLQTFLVWQLVFSAILLGRKYSWNQIAGCVIVTAGVVVAVGRYHFVGLFVSAIFIFLHLQFFFLYLQPIFYIFYQLFVKRRISKTVEDVNKKKASKFLFLAPSHPYTL